MTDNVTTEIGASLTARGVVLQPITESDYPGLRRLELGERMLHHWRFGGHTPSPERYAQILWDGVYSQYIIVERSEQARPVGFVMLYDVDLVHGWGYLGAARFMDGVMGSALFIEGFAAFLDLSFKLAPLRKVYFEVPEYNLDTFQSAIGPLLEVEGVLREHRFFASQLWDVHVLAIRRDNWEEYIERFRERMELG